MVTVEKCCLCLRLSNGGVILGTVGAFTSLVLVIVIGGFVLNYDNYVQERYAKGEIDAESHKLALFLDRYKTTLVTLIWIYVSLQFINFVGSLALVCGTIHKRPKLVFLWLVSQSFLIVFWTLGSVLTNDINMTLYAVLCAYFWICIFSLYKEINIELYQQSLHYRIQAV